MELNEYNGFDEHCKTGELDLKRMDIIMQRKDPEFIDHTLLAPEYMRDPNNFIMDLMNFQKGVAAAQHSGATDTLPADLQFHNSLFPESSEGQAQPQPQHHQHQHQHQHQQHHHAHADECQKTQAGVFMPLNSDFLMPVSKSFNTAVDQVDSVVDSSVKGVQQLLLADTNVTLDDGSIDEECDVSRFNSRKILPHKKRISRKLRITHDDPGLQLNGPLKDHKLPHVEQLVVGPGVQQFRCELCVHVTCSQLEFFAHLKQHYEPSTPDTILAAMKTSLDVLGPEKTAGQSSMCAIGKKTDGLDHVFQDVNFPFENFPQPDEVGAVRVVMEPQRNVERVDMKMVANNALDIAIGASSAAVMHPHEQVEQAQQGTQSLVPEEYSDTDDMLEGIGHKVLIEDNCDTMDLMAPSSHCVRPHWFTNNCFNGIDLKPKPYCDVLFSSQFTPLLNAEAQVTQVKDLVDVSATSQLVGAPNATDLRLSFAQSETNASIHQPPPTQNLLSNPEEIIPSHHIKVEENTDNATFHRDDRRDGDEAADGMGVDIHQNDHFSDASYAPSPGSQFSDQSNGCYEAECAEDADCSVEDCEEGAAEVGVTQNGKRKRYVCTKCQRVFNSCNALKYHCRTHSGLRPHSCDICGKAFFAIGALKAHIRTHTGDKPFECEHCNRKFRQWGDLKYHTISIHSNEKNHQCEFCGKAFSRKYSLVLHLRIHTSERNYKCEFCTKTFRASTYLQNHRKIHTGEKPYECDVCTKKFRVSGDLRRHKRIHERALNQKHAKKLAQEESLSALKTTSASPNTTSV